MSRAGLLFLCACFLGAACAEVGEPSALLSAARDDIKAGRYLEARSRLAAVLAVDPQHKDARKLNSKVCQEIYAASFAACLDRSDRERQAGRDIEAMAALREILLVDPDYKQALARRRSLAEKTLDAANDAFDRGIARSDEKKYSEAIEAYRQAMLLKPDFIEAVVNLGQLYYLNGQYNDALAVFQEAFTINPKDPIVLNNLAATHDALGHYQDAIRLWREFLRYSQDRLLVPEAEENILVSEGRLLRNRLRQEPGNPDLHVAVVDNLIRQKKFDRARQQLEKSREEKWDEPTLARLRELDKRIREGEAAAAQRRPPR